MKPLPIPLGLAIAVWIPFAQLCSAEVKDDMALQGISTNAYISQLRQITSICVDYRVERKNKSGEIQIFEVQYADMGDNASAFSCRIDKSKNDANGKQSEIIVPMVNCFATKERIGSIDYNTGTSFVGLNTAANVDGKLLMSQPPFFAPLTAFYVGKDALPKVYFVSWFKRPGVLRKKYAAWGNSDVRGSTEQGPAWFDPKVQQRFEAKTDTDGFPTDIVARTSYDDFKVPQIEKHIEYMVFKGTDGEYKIPSQVKIIKRGNQDGKAVEMVEEYKIHGSPVINDLRAVMARLKAPEYDAANKIIDVDTNMEVDP